LLWVWDGVGVGLYSDPKITLISILAGAGRARFLAKIPKVLRELFFQSFRYYRFDYWVTGNLDFGFGIVGAQFTEPVKGVH
jgi:hypothetical protein